MHAGSGKNVIMQLMLVETTPLPLRRKILEKALGSLLHGEAMPFESGMPSGMAGTRGVYLARTR